MRTDEKLTQLRALMKEKAFYAYIIPSDDFHSSEYVGRYFKAREYMSGFTGSAGTLVVLPDKRRFGQTADISSGRGAA